MSAGRRRFVLIAGCLALMIALAFGPSNRALAFDDVYEPDNVLAQAKPIPTDGSIQTHWFEGNDASDWVSFDATAGREHVVATDEVTDEYLRDVGPMCVVAVGLAMRDMLD